LRCSFFLPGTSQSIIKYGLLTGTPFRNIFQSPSLVNDKALLTVRISTPRWRDSREHHRDGWGSSNATKRCVISPRRATIFGSKASLVTS
jgi:hypothetical protein